MISDFVLMQIPSSNGTLALSTFAADADGAVAAADEDEGEGSTISTTIADPVASERGTGTER